MPSLAELGISQGDTVGATSVDGVLQEVQVIKIQPPQTEFTTLRPSGHAAAYMIPGRIYITPPLADVEQHVVYYPDTQTFRIFDTHRAYQDRKQCVGELLVEEMPFDFTGFQSVNRNT